MSMVIIRWRLAFALERCKVLEPDDRTKDGVINFLLALLNVMAMNSRTPSFVNFGRFAAMEKMINLANFNLVRGTNRSALIFFCNFRCARSE